MKNTYSIRQLKYCALLSTILLLVLSTNTFAQVREPFTQRTSTKADQKYVKKGSEGKIYNLRGDFKMAGNTNLTFVNYTDNGTNSDEMKYVDIDLDGSTINSSSSYLEIPNDGCAEIVYAGLYWSGRANTGAMSFNVKGNPQTGLPATTQTINHTHNMNTVNALDYTSVLINRQGTTNAYYPVQYVTIGDKELEFTINNNGTISQRERINGGAWSVAAAVAISNTNNSAVSTIPNNSSWNRNNSSDYNELNPNNSTQRFCYRGYTRTVTETTSGNIIYTLATPIVYNYSGVNYTISQIASYFRSQRTRTEIGYTRATISATQNCGSNGYDNNSGNYYNVSQGSWSTAVYNATQNQFRDNTNNYVTIEGPRTTVTLTKNIVKFKHANGTYKTITASTGDIYYPNGDDSDMYAAYADVTDEVIEHGGGNYFVADIATTEGTIDNIGQFGGWGLVVIYADPSMKWRDITVFDGYAYVIAGNANHQLPISGFKAAQSGLVNVDIGVMAGEGDRSYSGDYFQVLGRGGDASNAAHYKNLGNSGSTGGFFNSNIDTGSIKNPSLVNNTGIDIQRIALPNQTQAYTNQSSTITSNYIIGNNAESTTFRYGSTQDTYIIYNIVFAVDAYVPEALPINMATKITTKGTPSDPSRVITDPVEITSYMNILQPGDELEMEMKIINTGNERVLGSNIEMVIPKELELVPGTLGMTKNINASTFAGTTTEIAAAQAAVNAFSQPVWTPAVALPDYEGGTVAWYLGTIPVQPPNSDPFQVTPMAIMKYTLKVTENCDYLKYSNATCMVAPKLSGGIEGVGENSGTSMADQGFITGIINANCRIYQIGTLDFQVPVKEEYLLENCKNDNIIKDVNLNYPCGNTVQGNSFNISTHDFLYKTDAELLADNDPATMPGQLISRYPIGTWFFDVVPSTGVVTPLNLTSSTMSVDVTNNNGIHTGYLYAVIPEHQVSAPGPYTCYYIVTIKIDTTVEKPKVPANTIEKCSGENYDYNVFVETTTIGNVGFLYSRKVNGVWQAIGNVKPLPSSRGIYEYGVEQVVYDASNNILCRSAMAEYNITIKGCSMKVNPQIYNTFK